MKTTVAAAVSATVDDQSKSVTLWLVVDVDGTPTEVGNPVECSGWLRSTLAVSELSDQIREHLNESIWKALGDHQLVPRTT